MIRILQVVNNMHRAGLETMLMNYYRNMDRTKIQFDFLVHRPEKSDYDDEILSLGGKIYHAPRLYPQNYPAYFKFMKQFFKDHPEYKIIHSHIDAMSYLPLKVAKNAGVPIRIAHSHSTSIDRDFKYPLKQLFRYRLTHVANYYCACGEEAGKFLFRGKEFKFIPNAIELDKFLFNQLTRDKIRSQLNIQDKYVIGHVGRFSYPKNHEYLIEILKRVRETEENAVLMLVGTGEKLDQIKELVKSYNLEDFVLFMGNRSDVQDLYQAMDVFVMPSLFEGIPLTGIEAQFSGLPCIFSDNVPVEVKQTSNIEFLSINFNNIDEWVRDILNFLHNDRKLLEHESKENEYNIKNAKLILEKFYDSF